MNRSHTSTGLQFINGCLLECVRILMSILNAYFNINICVTKQRLFVQFRSPLMLHICRTTGTYCVTCLFLGE